ncbi:MAG TPA: hypothetical protein VKF32_05505 [Thermoanaerobaculia bacterium]|nr:hypothetical protein [Thermoanaerobaculia bacterium]
MKAAALSAPRVAALAAFVILCATTDERSFGVMPDGKEMLSASAAIARFFEIGVSRDFVNAVPRRAGDAVSRYGFGQSAADALPMEGARLLHAASPSARSTTLFVLARVLLLALAAGSLAAAAEALGAPAALAALAGIGLVLATPAWGYAGSDLPEALQLASVSLLVAAAAILRTQHARAAPAATPRWEAVAGLAAGVALLAKSLLLAVAVPLLLAAVLTRPDEAPKQRRGRGPRPAAAPPRLRVLAFFAPLAIVWAVLELARFGTLFGGYPGETFTYPPLAGLLRLTLLPNKGLLLYAPSVALAPLGLVLLARRDRALALALAASAGAVFASAAAWWAWDGQAGWGPRLLVPALPMLMLLAALAAAWGSAAVRLVAAATAGAGVLVNALGALVPFPQVYALVSTAPPRPISAARAEGTQYEIERTADGTLLATAPHHLSLTPSWSPLRVHYRLLVEKLKGGDIGARLASSGLSGFDPPLSPRIPQAPSPALRAALTPFAWPFLSRALVAPLAGTADPARDALRDQAVRAVDVGRYARALASARELLSTDRSDEADIALAAEAALRLGRRADAEALLASAPRSCHPWILFVRREGGRGDFACVPEAERAGFAAGVDAALAQGATLTAWARAGRQGS